MTQQPTNGVFEEVYERIVRLPHDELMQIMKNVLNPQELFMRADGSTHQVHKLGTKLFESKGLLEEVGIPENDPRSAVYRSLLGSKIDEDIPKALRAIAAKEETVGRNAGAIQVWDEGHKVWWVPVGATSKFHGAMNELIDEFNDQVNRSLLQKYNTIRTESIERFEKAAQITWEEMNKLGRMTVSKDDYVRQSMDTFVQHFPNENDIRSKVKMEMVAVEAPLPPQVENILSDVRAAAREKLVAQAEESRVKTKTQEVQLRMVQIDEELKQSELDKVTYERAFRQQILREHILEDPQVLRAKEIVSQFSANLIMVSHEIMTAQQSGVPISPSTKRSWQKKLKPFQELTLDNPELEALLPVLSDMIEVKQTEETTMACARMVTESLNKMAQDANVEVNADALWQVIQAGHSEDIISQMKVMMNDCDTKKNQIEAMLEFATTVGANNMSMKIETEGAKNG